MCPYPYRAVNALPVTVKNMMNTIEAQTGFSGTILLYGYHPKDGRSKSLVYVLPMLFIPFLLIYVVGSCSASTTAKMKADVLGLMQSPSGNISMNPLLII